MIKRFKAYCFEFLLWNVSLVQFPMEEGGISPVFGIGANRASREIWVASGL